MGAFKTRNLAALPWGQSSAVRVCIGHCLLVSEEVQLEITGSLDRSTSNKEGEREGTVVGFAGLV